MSLIKKNEDKKECGRDKTQSMNSIYLIISK